MRLFGKSKQDTEPRLTMNFSDALRTAKAGGPKAEPEEEIPGKVWDDVWRRMKPYTKTVAVECAQIYVDYVAKTGNTTCPREEIAHHMRNLLWDAFRRAEIQKKYSEVTTLPNLAPYFVDMVRLLNSNDTADNHVAYFCEKDRGTNNVAWFVAPVDEAKQIPKVASGKADFVDQMLL